ncbi:hypothetical protein ACJW30_05G011400 [Castanea mollissima]
MTTLERKSKRKPRKIGAHVDGGGGTDVPESSFGGICGLKLLDLSNTAIESLPDSVLSLDNLTVLTLSGCRNLKLVPSLAKLISLNKLDLGQTGITEVPDGLEMLVDLRYLSLNAPELKIMPPGILPNLSRLQYLTVFWHSKYVIVEEKEIESLKKLETFGGHFKDMDEFRRYIKCLENRPLACYEIRVGMSGDGSYLIGEISGKSVILGDCLEKSFELPKDVQYLEIKRCHDITSLWDVPSLNDTSEIKHIGLFLCLGIDHILSFASSSSSCTHSLQTLEILELYNLENLLVMFEIEEAGSSRVPRDTFSCLKRILICNCSRIKKLLPPGLLLQLHNLEEIWVSFCEKLEEIAEEDKEERDTIQITLPRLRILHLSGLLELKTICSKEIVCDSLEKLEIHGCPKLKRLPFLPSKCPKLKDPVFPSTLLG